MDILKQFGITEDDYLSLDLTDTVDGRVVHIDADFIAYQISAYDDVTFDEMKENTYSVVEKIMEAAGATDYHLHLTDPNSNKGQRYTYAITKEYQANREDKVRPPLLHDIKHYMADTLQATMYTDMEADDGMSIAQNLAIANGDWDRSIIASEDKDLWMVQGLNLNPRTGIITDTKDEGSFGHIELLVKDNKAKTKKIIGRGTAYFWAQMLMGDAADNIAGLPKLYHPDYLTKAGAARSCGPVVTYELLQNIKSDAEALELVKSLYKLYGENEKIVHWNTGKEYTWTQLFTSEAILLWMRRTNDIRDALKWIKEI